MDNSQIITLVAALCGGAFVKLLDVLSNRGKTKADAASILVGVSIQQVEAIAAQSALLVVQVGELRKQVDLLQARLDEIEDERDRIQNRLTESEMERDRITYRLAQYKLRVEELENVCVVNNIVVQAHAEWVKTLDN